MWITVEDLAPFVDVEVAKASAMIDDAEAMALHVAPCLGESELSVAQVAVVRAILRGAILRWITAGDGAVTQQQAGPFQMTTDNRQTRKSIFWPTEITQLQAVCAGDGTGKAFSIDTAPSMGYTHRPWCDLTWSESCSCGGDIAGHPLYELGT